jgi:hypothetical protein
MARYSQRNARSICWSWVFLCGMLVIIIIILIVAWYIYLIFYVLFIYLFIGTGSKYGWFYDNCKQFREETRYMKRWTKFNL